MNRSGHPTTVASGFVSGLVSALPRSGLNVSTALGSAGIAITVLSDPTARVPVARYAALYRGVSAALDDEAFGLLSRPLPVGSFEFLCRAILSADTLADALNRCARYLRVVQDDFALEVQAGSNGQAALRLIERRPLAVESAGRVFVHEWLLRLLHGLSAWLVAHPLPLDAAAFPYPAPAHSADYALVFAPSCSFNASCLEACFAVDWLALPVRRDEAALTAFLRDAPASITTLYRRDRSLTLRVREHLRAALPAAPPLEAVAARLFLSPRTLHRRLEEEGTRFSAIREALRRDLAIEWLTKTAKPIQQIGSELGFADAGSFFRAFSGWTGSGPREYRRRFGGAGGLP